MEKAPERQVEGHPGRLDLLVVGDSGEAHVGAHLYEAARDLGLKAAFCDVREAFRGWRWLARFNWWLRGRRPPRLKRFSREILQVCLDYRPTFVVCTGIAPLEPWAVREIGATGAWRLNYLTDDPWNPRHHANWFLKALPYYDHVYSPRRQNLQDLHDAGCPRVSYLPFGYAPKKHFPEPPAGPEEQARLRGDVMFAGGADKDRLVYVQALIRSEFQVALYGGYWERFPHTRAYSRGLADLRTLRRAVNATAAVLCLVRKANRDGHAMRTFEVPAMGGCMLVEDTEEHRDIFGTDGEAVVYFQAVSEMVEKLRWLLTHDEERARLSQRAHDLIVQGSNTYKDRLASMLGLSPKGDVR